MSEVTRILVSLQQGDAQAAEQLLPLVYQELRRLAAVRLAQEKPGHTLQATALVHEAYLRLADGGQAQNWNSRGHFFGAAAEAMRRILVESARSKRAAKRGGGGRRVDLDVIEPAVADVDDDVLDFDEALEALATEDAETAQLVKLRYFAGLSVEECGQALGISRSTAYDHWTFARAWLRCRLRGEAS